jgi:hypothetical protein
MVLPRVASANASLMLRLVESPLCCPPSGKGKDPGTLGYRGLSVLSMEEPVALGPTGLHADVLGRAPLVLSVGWPPSAGDEGSAPPSLCLSTCHGSSVKGPNQATAALATIAVGQHLFLPPYIVIRSFPINELKLLLCVIPFCS